MSPGISKVNEQHRPSQNFAHAQLRTWSPRLGVSRSMEQKVSSHSWWSHNRGMMLVLVAEIFGGVMGASARLLETSRDDERSGMHPFQILFARMVVTWVLSSMYMWYAKIPHFPFGEKEVRDLLVLRGLAGFVGIVGYYYSLQSLPMAEATVIIFLTPMLTSWASALLLRQPLDRKELFAGLISLAGVVCIAVPNLSFFKSQTAQPSEPLLSSQNRITSIILGLVGVLGSVCAFTLIRHIGTRAHALISVSYYSSMCTILTTISFLALPSSILKFQLPVNAKEWLLLGFLGVSGFLLQFLLTAGLQADKTSRATNMMYTQILYALITDKVIWGTVPGWMSAIGGVLVTASTVWVVVMKPEKETPRPLVEPGEAELALLSESDDEEGEQGAELGVIEEDERNNGQTQSL